MNENSPLPLPLCLAGTLNILS